MKTLLVILLCAAPVLAAPRFDAEDPEAPLVTRPLFPELEKRLAAAYVAGPRVQFGPVTADERKRFADAFALLLTEAVENTPDAPTAAVRTAFDALGFRIESIGMPSAAPVWGLFEYAERPRGGGAYLIRTGPDAGPWSAGALGPGGSRVAAWSPAGAGLPGASAPGASAPGASAPGFSLPGASAPGASAPGASAPGASAPGYGLPGASAPGASAPGFSLPGASAPGNSADGQHSLRVASRATLHGVQRVVVLAPHPRTDRGTEVLAQRLFGLSRARALLQASTSRAARAPDGTPGDVAHRSDTFFQVATEVLDARIADQLFLELHGFEIKHHDDLPRGTNVILSDANPEPRDDPRFTAAAAMLRARHQTGSVALWGSDTKRLGGTTNAQARHINPRGRNTFMHVEMSAVTRSASLQDTAGLPPPATSWMASLMTLVTGR